MVSPPPDGDRELYMVKRVSFLGRENVPIICQNENGPCPLLGIANVLLLRNVIQLEGPSDRPEVSTGELMSLIAARLLDVNASSTTTSNENSFVRQNQEQNLNDAMAVLPSLATGLDVNVRFRHPLDFEFTAELAVFDLLDVTLCHAWVVDPEWRTARDAIGARSYNQLMERLIELVTAEEQEPSKVLMVTEPTEMEEDETLRSALKLSLDDKEDEPSRLSPTSAAVAQVLDETVRGIENENKASEASTSSDAKVERTVIESFLESSASQLTRRGLTDARSALKERELCVFFRNNHFATVFKFQGALYLLATDFGYLGEPDVVWEVLCSVEGSQGAQKALEGSFVNSRFEPFLPHAETTAQTTEDDARLAAALLASAAEVGPEMRSTGNTSDIAPIETLPQTFLRAPSSADASSPKSAEADADHALAVALQAEYEEELAREDAAARCRGSEASAATRQALLTRQQQQPPRRTTTAASRTSRQPPRSKKSSYSSDCVVM